MILRSILFSLILIATTQRAAAQSWQWAKQAGDSATDAGYSVATDAAGNVYVAGLYSSDSISFGTFTFLNSTIGAPFANSYEIFLVKYSPSGNVIWAKSYGSTSLDRAYSIAVDQWGNIYLTGYYSGNITFGSTTLMGSGTTKMFLTKINSSGTVIWSQASNGEAEGHSIALDSHGNVYIGGFFASTSITFGASTIFSNGANDAYLVKYDSSGIVHWAKNIGGTDYEDLNAVMCDQFDNIYVGGSFFSNSVTTATTALTNAGSTDFFLIRYDTSGNEIWARSAGGI